MYFFMSIIINVSATAVKDNTKIKCISMQSLQATQQL